MSLVEEMALLRQEGRQVLLVSSGAVALGMKQLGLTERPRSLGLRQACAAVGQGHLVALYTSAFAQFGVTAAQVLLTESDLGDRDRALCVRTTLMRLLELRAVPVLNENDSVSIRELVEHRRAQGAGRPARPPFGDNDGLSARVAIGVDADLLVLLTDVDGLYTADPAHRPGRPAHRRARCRVPAAGRGRARGAPAACPASSRRRVWPAGRESPRSSPPEAAPNVLRPAARRRGGGDLRPGRRAPRGAPAAHRPGAARRARWWSNDGALAALEGGRRRCCPSG